MNEGTPPAADPVVEESTPCTARQPLSAWERRVCVPLGFLWLIILLLIAIPVCIYMTILYYVVLVAQWLAGIGSATRRSGTAIVVLLLVHIATTTPVCQRDANRRREPKPPNSGSIRVGESGSAPPGTMLQLPGGRCRLT